MYEKYKTAEKKFWHPMSSSAPEQRSKTSRFGIGPRPFDTPASRHPLSEGGAEKRAWPFKAFEPDDYSRFTTRVKMS
jgi:hypothetical protein